MPPWRFVMNDPDRYDLDLLEPLGAVAPPTPEVLDRVAANLHARFLHDATSRARLATFTRQRTRVVLPVAAAAARSDPYMTPSHSRRSSLAGSSITRRTLSKSMTWRRWVS